MPAYRVSFFKELLSSDGHPFNCLQRQFDIADAQSAELAVESAMRKLESLRDIPDWTLVADFFEVRAAGRGRPAPHEASRDRLA